MVASRSKKLNNYHTVISPWLPVTLYFVRVDYVYVRPWLMKTCHHCHCKWPLCRRIPKKHSFPDFWENFRTMCKRLKPGVLSTVCERQVRGYKHTYTGHIMCVCFSTHTHTQYLTLFTQNQCTQSLWTHCSNTHTIVEVGNNNLNVLCVIIIWV